MLTKSLNIIVLSGILISGLSGCGGSGTNESSNPPPSPPPPPPPPLTAEREGYSVARMWNEQVLHAIRNDFARPTIHARNLFHISSAMYDAWASYDSNSQGFLFGSEVSGYRCDAMQINVPADTLLLQEEALSFAAYRLIRQRFRFSPGVGFIYNDIEQLMDELGFDSSIASVDYSTGSAAALGNAIAQCYIDFGLQDGSNEQNDYANTVYTPVNPPLVINSEESGNPDIIDLNRWQPLAIDGFIDQAGNPVDGTIEFLGPEWGGVIPFSLKAEDMTIYQREGKDYPVYHDPGLPPLIDGTQSDLYKWGFSMVAIWQSHLTTEDNIMWDISPNNLGNITYLPTSFEEFQTFYNYLDGGDPSAGHVSNPVTGAPYEIQMVPRGDYARVLAEFWADGPDSETPPGHWFVIMNSVIDHPSFEKRWAGQGDILSNLEWDIKSYFALGGTMHDAAIAAWGIKGWYDYIRPVSAIRGMAEKGQSSEMAVPSYHPDGLPLVPGFIEIIEQGDPLEGAVQENVGKIKLYTWRGPDYIEDPTQDVAAVGWILAADWWPYQRPSFVTPPFAGYVSGHSTFSRAAAELLTAMTGSEYFPGGLSNFEIPANDFLVFERGPSVAMTLQWATYRDASDQTSLSRIWGGIHPPADDIPGRLIGIEIGTDAYQFVNQFFNE
jgi:hypothetical protein